MSILDGYWAKYDATLARVRAEKLESGLGVGLRFAHCGQHKPVDGL